MATDKKSAPASAKPKQGAPDKHGEAMQRYILANCSRSPDRALVKKLGRK